MARPRSLLADVVVYVLVRFLVALLQVLSYERARGVARLLGWLAYRVDRKHRLRADENLVHAFGDGLTPRQRDALIRQVYAHFCTLFVEIVHLTRRLHVHNWKRYAELIGGDRIVGSLVSGRPLLIVTGHLGNWEIAGIALGLLGFHTHAIARTLDNPFLDDYLRGLRQRTGQKILAKKGEFDDIQDVLAAGGAIATLADQDAGPRGVFVDFFGRPASTHKAVALLALEYRVPLLVVGVPRLDTDGSDRYRIMAADFIDPDEYQGRPDAIKAMTQRYTTALERLICLAPEQYFWLHRRWKHQPQARRAASERPERKRASTAAASPPRSPCTPCHTVAA